MLWPNAHALLCSCHGLIQSFKQASLWAAPFLLGDTWPSVSLIGSPNTALPFSRVHPSDGVRLTSLSHRHANFSRPSSFTKEFSSSTLQTWKVSFRPFLGQYSMFVGSSLQSTMACLYFLLALAMFYLITQKTHFSLSFSIFLSIPQWREKRKK